MYLMFMFVLVSCIANFLLKLELRNTCNCLMTVHSPVSFHYSIQAFLRIGSDVSREDKILRVEAVMEEVSYIFVFSRYKC